MLMIEETCFTTILTCKLDMYSSRGGLQKTYQKAPKNHMERNWLGEEGRKQFPANSSSMESAKNEI